MKNKGFSLVELIVVIAIMAILVGVAVPVYSSYIEKTQKNKDIQMVDEIKHAIEIAAVGDSWATKLTPGVVGTIVITSENMTVNDDTAAKLLEKAINDTFGANNSMKLSYDGWTGTLNAGGVTVITGSAYSANPEQLLGTVQDVTDLFEVFIDTNGDGVVDNLTLTEEGQTFFNEMNIDSTNSQQLANGMVSYVAETALGVDEALFVDAWIGTLEQSKSKFGDVLSSDIFAKKAAEYAFVESMCTYADKAGCTTEKTLRQAFNEYNADWNGANPVVDVYAEHCKTCEKCGALEGIDDPARVENDAKAYLALMKQVSQSKDVVSSNASSDTLYTGSPLKNYVSSYVSVASLLAEAAAEDGDVVLVVTIDATGNVVVNAYPIDY